MVRIFTTLLPSDKGTARVAGLDVVRDAERASGRGGSGGSVRGRRREPHRLREPGDGRSPLPPAASRGQAPGAGRARAVRPRRRRRIGPPRPTRAACAGGSTWAPAWWAGRRSCSWTSRPPGLDPRSRLDLWDLIRELVSDGTTLLLTTQYLEEADILTERDRGDRSRHGDRRGDGRGAEDAASVATSWTSASSARTWSKAMEAVAGMGTGDADQQGDRGDHHLGRAGERRRPAGRHGPAVGPSKASGSPTSSSGAPRSTTSSSRSRAGPPRTAKTRTEAEPKKKRGRKRRSE